MFVVSTALTRVVQAAMFLYATEGLVADGFEQSDLDGAVVAKP